MSFRRPDVLHHRTSVLLAEGEGQSEREVVEQGKKDIFDLSARSHIPFASKVPFDNAAELSRVEVGMVKADHPAGVWPTGLSALWPEDQTTHNS